MDGYLGTYRRVVVVAVLVVTALVVVAPVGASEGWSTGANVESDALFEGRPIDLSSGWGDATACLIWDEVGVRECFRTEAEMDVRVAELEGKLVESGLKASQCSSSVRLYDGVVYTGSVLYLRDRYIWINLSSYNFSDRTSSFKIGACPAVFADGTSGGDPRYPTSDTQAYDVAPVMASGWGNRVSSIYIG